MTGAEPHGPPLPAKLAARRLLGSKVAEGFTPAGLYAYTDRNGAPIFYRARLNPPNGSGEKKVVRPLHADGAEWKIGEPVFSEGGKPLYALHRLAAADAAAPVYFVEGESCADALLRLGVLATTADGAQSDERADFSPLARLRVTLWPDNDKPGREHMQRVAAKLTALGCTVETLDIDALDLPETGDVVDYLRAHPGATAGDLASLRRIPSGRAAASCEAAPPVDLIRGDTVTIEPIRWAWRGWLARGKLHIMAGAPGTGKTTLALAFAATITVGGRWPDGSRAEPGDVLIWSGEDDPRDTMAPRLLAMGADLRRIHFVGAVREEGDGPRAFDPASDMPRLRAAVTQAGIVPRLLIVDPIVNAVAGDSHKNGEVRRALAPVCDLAREVDCVALGISHFSKGGAGRDPVERVTGSLAFGALARVVMATAKRPDEQGGGRILARAKSNIGPDGGGFAYEVETLFLPDHPDVESSRILWREPLEGTARELLADADNADDAGTERRDAGDWLREVLTEEGQQEARALRRLAEDAGFAWRTVQRAAKAAGAQIVRTGFGPKCRTVWRLPVAPDSPVAPVAPTKKLGASGASDGFGATVHPLQHGAEPSR